MAIILGKIQPNLSIKSQYEMGKLTIINAQGFRVSIVVLQVGAVQTYVEYWRRTGKRKEGMKLNSPPKLLEKLVWVPVISFCKISFPIKHLMPYYAATGRSCPLVA
jgi:hypothetical protein